MRKGLVLIVMCVTMLFAAAPSVRAQVTGDEYRTELQKMLTLSGSMASAQAMVPQMITMLKRQTPSVATSFWDNFQKKWEVKFGNRLVELYVPIYQKYLTLDDLKDINTFYESPVGKKLGSSTPAMMTEGMQLGQQLGMEIATELQQELAAQGNK